MKDIEVVVENLSTKGIKIDDTQILFLKEFLAQDSKYKPSRFFYKNNSMSNLYLWGPVGRGKTMMLQAINDSYFTNSGQFHFIEFMQLVHKKLSFFSGSGDPLIKVVKSLAKEYKIIFIDEFQIDDIADAMIIGTLIECIVNNGMRIFISSNSHPDNLYKDGLQRSKFLKTIDFINKNFLIHHLAGSEDYRLREIVDFDSSAEDINSNKNVEKFLQRTFDKKIKNKNSFTVNGREFNCMGVTEKFLWLSFDDFFSMPCASIDFIEIIKKFEWVFINNFHFCNDDHKDKVRRFVSFIDIAYQENQKLKFFYDSKQMRNLYSGDQLHSIWIRIESRLYQMMTKKYLQNLEKNQTK